MGKSIVRTDKWHLSPTNEQLEHLRQTQEKYRQYVRALIGVVHLHFVEITSSESPCASVERLIHKTQKNPFPKYPYFAQRFYKLPSYLRRAAIKFAIGQVSSFLTRYRDWQGGNRKRKDARPPKLTADTNVYAALYRGQCIKFNGDLTQAQIKVFNGSDWIWITVEIKEKRQRHKNPLNQQLSPYLIVKRGKAYLAVPFRIQQQERKNNARILAADLGINTTCVASIVTSDGTVTARKFLSRGADIDRRDKRLKAISQKAKLTTGKGGKLHQGFGRNLYRKASHINREIAQKTSRELVNLALANQVHVIVFENLKGWRPKGGRKRSNLKQRFHGWLHRQIVKLTTEKFAEVGGKVETVYPRGTSSWAFDGSGKVQRDGRNYALAKFPNQKKYNADLGASYNIAARYWCWKLKLAYRNGRQLSSGKSPRDKRRIPVTLSTLWSGKSRFNAIA